MGCTPDDTEMKVITVSVREHACEEGYHGTHTTSHKRQTVGKEHAYNKLFQLQFPTGVTVGKEHAYNK